jgi:hypothetical protein
LEGRERERARERARERELYQPKDFSKAICSGQVFSWDDLLDLQTPGKERLQRPTLAAGERKA